MRGTLAQDRVRKRVRLWGSCSSWPVQTVFEDWFPRGWWALTFTPCVEVIKTLFYLYGFSDEPSCLVLGVGQNHRSSRKNGLCVFTCFESDDVAPLSVPYINVLSLLLSRPYWFVQWRSSYSIAWDSIKIVISNERSMLCRSYVFSIPSPLGLWFL